jgi:hypothetical protein
MPNSKQRAYFADPVVSDEGYAKKCHYTLDIFICGDKEWRKPKVTHVKPCLLRVGTASNNHKCTNMAKAPKVNELADLCSKCRPPTPGKTARGKAKEEILEVDLDESGDVMMSIAMHIQTLEEEKKAAKLEQKRKFAEQKEREAEKAEQDLQALREFHEIAKERVETEHMALKSGWTRVADDIPCLENGGVETKARSLFQRVFRTFKSPGSTKTDARQGMQIDDADATKATNKESEEIWENIDENLDWNVVDRTEEGDVE